MELKQKIEKIDGIVSNLKNCETTLKEVLDVKYYDPMLEHLFKSREMITLLANQLKAKYYDEQKKD